MSWLRLDDGFADHPKLLDLSTADRWTWIEVLCYCARYRTGGQVPPKLSSKIKRATPAFVERCFELGLLDQDADGELHVHDWKEYNGPLEAAARAKKRHRMRVAGVDEEIVREVAPYSDDIDFGRVSRQLSEQNRARIREVDIADGNDDLGSDLAQVERLPAFGDVLRDMDATSGVISGVNSRSRARYPQPQPQESVANRKSEATGSEWATRLRRTERIIWDGMSADERKAVVQAHRSSTGARFVRGSHGAGYILDPLGSDPVDRGEAPPEYDGRATPSDYLAAWAERRAKAARSAQ